MEKIAELADLIDRHAGTDGSFDTALPRVGIIRSSARTEPIHTLYEPSCCIVAQGRKRAVIGDSVHVYDAAHYLVVGVDLPVIGAVVEASASRPYLCLRLQLDRGLLAQMLPAIQGRLPESPAAGVSATTPDLLDAAVRMMRLLDTPEDAEVLAPLIEKEILYRLIRGPQGALLRQIANGESRLNQIGRAIDFVRKNFSEPFAIEHLASVAGMSASSFYEHFKTVMAMSPLQFRTQLRLQEARRLMVTEGLTAAEAGFRVGYDSPSQFSRDYVRVHNVPPRRDIERMRATAG
ncbi:AraC-like DNA-binding protein [Rhizobium sp. BK529]|uniref:AraC family transcriptional regulator n=1 Tax=unclassified Rhizobium TaxID=2613769 RepID=UPI00104EE8BB|nr:MULTISPECIES: AraC family transcriptional regulator [unclassified Rhizobium]MBB3592261.1 AraC-like DNA-binding protein [Rhizobium sp. BK529]TCS06682.1 AraC family transcriptional regulator [Rhizobium sp. BK418]